jgi:serine/threonine-protein kinase
VVLVPLLALLTGATVAGLLVHGLSGRGTPTVAAQTQDGGGFVLASADYVGRAVDDVAMQLSALGLAVHRRADRTAHAPAGTVTAVDPVGTRLRAGDVVTVTYAVGATPPATHSRLGPGRSSAQGSLVDEVAHTSTVPSAVRTTTVAPTTTPSSTTASTTPSTTTATTGTSSGTGSGSATPTTSATSGTASSTATTTPPTTPPTTTSAGTSAGTSAPTSTTNETTGTESGESH